MVGAWHGIVDDDDQAVIEVEQSHLYSRQWMNDYCNTNYYR
jgi:hypothetical protein